MGHDTTRQHYLPCVYLRNFSVDGAYADRSSTIWCLGERRLGPVSVEAECFGNYLFSKSNSAETEAEFKVVEDGYGEAVRKIWVNGNLTETEYFCLIYAAFEFHVRNLIHENQTGSEGFVAYRDRLSTLLNRLVCGHDLNRSLTPAEMLFEIARTWAVHLVRSPGPLLITSDNPSCCLAWKVEAKASFFILPVTPSVLAVVFDMRSTEICGGSLTECDGRVLLDMSARYCSRWVYATNQPTDTLTQFCRNVWATRTRQASVTDNAKWRTHLVGPVREDLFSFLRPIKRQT